jgi:pimeloyl-ACP methyl ester carboxylesterase
MLLPTRIETVDGHPLRVARLGSGPPLVLLHGYPENLQIWCEAAPLLAREFEVFAFDWPGLGYSDPWRGGTTPTHMAGRLRALLDNWGLERAVIAGMDMGGQPALAFAATYPERTRGVVVLNSLAMPEEKTSWEIAVLRKFGWNRFILRRMPHAVFFRAQHTFLPAGVRLSRELREDFWQAFRQPEVRKFLVRMCAGYQGTLPKLEAQYPSIRCPVLALWGEKDRHFPPVHAERLHTLIPGCGLEVLPGAEHWMAWYRAAEVAERIGAFARGCS